MGTNPKKQFSVNMNTEACKACGYCANVCPKEVYASGTNPNTSGYNYMNAAKPDSCIGCGTCVMVCPDFAITICERGA